MIEKRQALILSRKALLCPEQGLGMDIGNVAPGQVSVQHATFAPKNDSPQAGAFFSRFASRSHRLAKAVCLGKNLAFSVIFIGDERLFAA